MSRRLTGAVLLVLLARAVAWGVNAQTQPAAGPGIIRAEPVAADSLRGKVMCGYQGWFRCPGDAARMGWIHWSRDPARIAPSLLTFELWPDMAEETTRTTRCPRNSPTA
jgi:hypothetical protein